MSLLLNIPPVRSKRNINNLNLQEDQFIKTKLKVENDKIKVNNIELKAKVAELKDKQLQNELIKNLLSISYDKNY
ncbi:hypothetical protein C1645_840025 [Glomus cerebriforme]|uniref:Uncharacterized protein n=1 Tax=Glomus cerebriforme TaxID=658196 RepID=A0A397SAK3_9GLOM|nr:hypothetical protein C1645_840025 [Glomus cerebriforme]